MIVGSIYLELLKNLVASSCAMVTKLRIILEIIRIKAYKNDNLSLAIPNKCPPDRLHSAASGEECNERYPKGVVA